MNERFARPSFLLGALLLVLSCAPTAHAQDATDAALAAVREQVLYASYPEAIAGASAVLARTDITAAQRNTALELLATAQIATQQTADARVTLTTLFSRDPGHRLTDPDASPPVVSAFARAREAHPSPVVADLQHRSPGTLATRESPSIEVRVGAGADAVEEVRLAFRHSGESGYTRVVLNHRADGVWTARIPVVGATDQAIDVAYFLTATAPSGMELGHLGSEAEPLTLRIPADTSGAIAGDPIPMPAPSGGGDVTGEAWFWVLLTAAVVGAGVGIGFGVNEASRGPEAGTLGIVMLRH
jgi:hypothetical protein